MKLIQEAGFALVMTSIAAFAGALFVGLLMGIYYVVGWAFNL